MENKLKKIFIVSGNARHGKDTTCMFIKQLCEEKKLKVINLSYGSYIKEYVKNITDWDGSEETKENYRGALQMVGTEIVRDKIDENFFVERLCNDIRVYSYFFDVITISDARMINEIEMPKKYFANCVSLKIERLNYETILSNEQKNHRTETSLNNYDNFDYKLLNDSTLDALKDKVKLIVEGEI